ncbi:MAG: hypothetical protein IH944_13240 [Armatimonadetes bacterium]|nr:hypothetical protein [Armatimonadota bacterium]
MKKSICIVVLGLAVFAFAVQRGLPTGVATHVSTLTKAKSFTAKFTVQEIGGTLEEFTVTYGKPDMLRIESPSKLVVSDGKTLTVYDKKAKTYSEEPASKAIMLSHITQPSLWGWASFLQSDTTKLIKSGKDGRSRRLRGVDVTESTVTLADGESTATFYLDAKIGFARGYNIASEGKEWIVWAKEIEVSEDESTDDFVFHAPAGAKLVEDVAAGGATWSAVNDLLQSKCMPCHGRTASGGVNMTSYRQLMRSRVVNAGNPNRSRIVRAIKGRGVTRMPKGRAALKDEEIKLIEDWISAGAKEE